MRLLQETHKTTSKYLQYYSNPEGGYSYIAKVPIIQKQTLLGLVVIEFKPKKAFKKSNIYQPKSIIGQNIKSVGLVAGFDDFKSDICLGEIGFY